MKKLNEYSKNERVIIVISIVWLIIWFVVGLEESRGDFDEDFMGIFSIFGLLPIIIVIGIKWIKEANKEEG